MSTKSKTRSGKTDKYWTKTDRYRPGDEQPFFIHRGQRVPAGGVPEILRHLDAHWYSYLERVWNRPWLSKSNPLGEYKGHDLRAGLKQRGYIDLSPQEILEKAESYFDQIGSGEREPYRDETLFPISTAA